MLQHEYLVETIGFNTAENEAPRILRKRGIDPLSPPRGSTGPISKVQVLAAPLSRSDRYRVRGQQSD